MASLLYTHSVTVNYQSSVMMWLILSLVQVCYCQVLPLLSALSTYAPVSIFHMFWDQRALIVWCTISFTLKVHLLVE